MTWTVLIPFDFTPDNTSEPIHVEPEDVITDVQCSAERGAVFVDLGLLFANP